MSCYSNLNEKRTIQSPEMHLLAQRNKHRAINYSLWIYFSFTRMQKYKDKKNEIFAPISSGASKLAAGMKSE